MSKTKQKITISFQSTYTLLECDLTVMQSTHNAVFLWMGWLEHTLPWEFLKRTENMGGFIQKEFIQVLSNSPRRKADISPESLTSVERCVCVLFLFLNFLLDKMYFTLQFIQSVVKFLQRSYARTIINYLC